MVHLENLPNTNQPREEEKEEGNEVVRPSGPRHGAGQRLGTPGEAVDVESSRTGPNNGYMIGNTSGGSTIQLSRVNFSPGVRTPSGSGGHTIRHMSSAGRGAGAPQGRGRGFHPNRSNTRDSSAHRVPPTHNSNNTVFMSASGQDPSWWGGRS